MNEQEYLAYCKLSAMLTLICDKLEISIPEVNNRFSEIYVKDNENRGDFKDE